MHEAQPSGEDRELKDKLLRRFGGHIGTLKREFSKKKKKGKLPKEARQTLLGWWNVHYKWPYPTVRISLLGCLCFSFVLKYASGVILLVSDAYIYILNSRNYFLGVKLRRVALYMFCPRTASCLVTRPWVIALKA